MHILHYYLQNFLSVYLVVGGSDRDIPWSYIFLICMLYHAFILGVLCGRRRVMMLCSCLYEQAIEDHTFIVSLPQWSAQGDVDMFYTHICVQGSLHD